MPGGEIECSAVGERVEQIEPAHPLLAFDLQRVVVRRTTAISYFNVTEGGYGSPILICGATSRCGGEAGGRLIVIGQDLQMGTFVADVSDIKQDATWKFPLNIKEETLYVACFKLGINVA